MTLMIFFILCLGLVGFLYIAKTKGQDGGDVERLNRLKQTLSRIIAGYQTQNTPEHPIPGLDDQNEALNNVDIKHNPQKARQTLDNVEEYIKTLEGSADNSPKQ